MYDLARLRLHQGRKRSAATDTAHRRNRQREETQENFGGRWIANSGRVTDSASEVPDPVVPEMPETPACAIKDLWRLTVNMCEPEAGHASVSISLRQIGV